MFPCPPITRRWVAAARCFINNLAPLEGRGARLSKTNKDIMRTRIHVRKVVLVLTLFLFVSCSSPQEKYAREQFVELIHLVDSCHNELGRYWEHEELSESELRQLTKERAATVSLIDEYALLASEVISPYDSLLSKDANICHSFANNAVFYANKYLEGEGPAYLDKFEVWVSHSWTALQDVKSGLGLN